MNGSDLWFIVVVTLGCTTGVFLIAAVVLRLSRRASFVWRIAIVVASAIASIACSTLAIAVGMYFTPHDLTVLLWILAVSAAFSMTGAWLVARGLRRSLAAVTAAARRLGDGEIVQRAAASREIAAMSAELAATSVRLADARAELERLDAARSAFFAWISHDLRTPLTGVRALAESLEDGMAADPADAGRRIRQQADAMSRMVDDLFELSRLQSGTLRPQREEVVLLDAVSDAVSDVRVLAEARSVKVAHGRVDGVPVQADPYLLGRVLTNLLGNAVRHAPSGSVVEVSAMPSAGDVVIGVLDTGPGVPGDDLERMFEAGWLADPARTPGRAGSSRAGLGLAIVRAIMEAHGGTVRAERTADGFLVAATLPRDAGVTA
ncbi:HAMP domain-containing sensor histidine kinase [Leifsonia sp. NPDC077715]|uniref:sensor histidine kinase n=1 Tax=Leifsonia sp. NPDC077715 TaxID=3155539 RepID=UPI00341E67EE